MTDEEEKCQARRVADSEQLVVGVCCTPPLSMSCNIGEPMITTAYIDRILAASKAEKIKKSLK